MPWLAGYSRERISWLLNVDAAKCVRCGGCMNCGTEGSETSRQEIALRRH